VPDYQVTARSHLVSDNTLVINTFCIRAEGVGTDPDPSFAQTLDEVENYFATYRAFLSNGFRLAGYDLTALDGSGETRTKELDILGGAAYLGSAVPAELCLVLSLRTAHPGRTGRGRVFLPSPLQGNVDGDNKNWATDTDYWANAGQFVQELLAGHTFDTGLGSQGHLSLRVHSRKDDAQYDVTSITRQRRVAWLESRSSAP
jgi:hypothetical protein